MDIFKGIGDFFRGAFGGESEEERKRRQQREAQARQAQKQSQQKTQQTQANQVRNQNPAQVDPKQPVQKPTVTPPKVVQPLVAAPRFDQASRNKQRLDTINAGLDKGQSFEDIAKAAKVDVTSVRKVAEKTRPGYGVKKEDNIAQKAYKLVVQPTVDSAQRFGTALGTGFGGEMEAQQRKSKESERAVAIIGEQLRQGKISREDALRRIKVETALDAELTKRAAAMVEETDPIKAGADFATLGLTAATAPGVSGLVRGGVKEGFKYAAKQGLREGAMLGAGFGALAPLQEKGGKATAEDIAIGSIIGGGTGAAAGVAFPLLGAGGRAAASRIRRGSGGTADDAARAGRGATTVNAGRVADDEVAELSQRLEGLKSEGEELTEDAIRARDAELENIVKRNIGDDETPELTPLPEGTTTITLKDSIEIADRVNTVFKKYLDDNPDLPMETVITARKTADNKIKQLVDELEASRKTNDEVVGEQEAKVEAEADKRADVNAEVKAAQENQGSETPVAADAELEANNAYTLDDAYAGVDKTTERIKDRQGETDNVLLKMINAVRGITTDKYREGVDKVRDSFNDFYYDKGIASSNGLTAGIARSPRALFDKAGMKDSDRLKASIYDSAKSANASRVKAQAKDIQDMFDEVDDPEATAIKLYQVFEQEDMLARMYGEGTPKLSIDDLSGTERQIADRLVELNKVRNEIWYRIQQERRKAGLLSEDQFMSARANYLAKQDGMHSPRIYEFDAAEMGFEIKGSKNTNAGAFKKRKDVAELSQSTIDQINANPAQSMLFRLQTGLDELARIDSINKLRDAGYIRPDAPNKNWTRLEGAQYGTANGMFADKQIVGQLEQRQVFNSDMGQKASDLLDTYRNSVLGTLDRAIKKSKTVYSPGTFIGNLTSNPLLFNRGSGVNALSQSINMARNVPTLTSHLNGNKLDQDILDMQRLGVKLGYTADELTGSPQNFQVIDDGGAVKSIKDIVMLPNKIYGGTDDLAKVSIFKTLRSRGMDAETAALRAAQFTQDYGNAGRAVQMLADSPILGAPFARFVPELIRLTKNNLVYNPVGTFAGLFGLAALQQHLFKQSGETDEERALRESAPGKVKVPFSAWVNEMVGGKGDISLDFPVGDSAVNAARALGFNFPLEPGTNATESLVKNLAPFAIPFARGANGDVEFQWQQLVTSMLLAPLAQQAANEDFMGRSVEDPTNKVRWNTSNGQETKYSDELDPATKLANRAYHLFMNYAPLSGEADAVATKAGVRDEITNPGVLDGGKDYYGKDRTPEQSIWRALGIKIENNDQTARDARIDSNRYFTEDLPATQAFLKENPDIADVYWKLKSTSKDRNTLIKATDLVTPERWQLIQSDKSGKLMGFLASQEQRVHDQSVIENQADPSKPIKPVDPIYQLNPEQQRTVINIMSRPTGDDKEAEQILRATQPWFTQFENSRRDFYKQNQAYYDSVDIESQSKQNPRVEEYYGIEYPEQQPLVKQYYQIMAEQGKDAAKEWGKTQGDALSEQFDADSAARLDYTNKKRKIEGYPPITPEVWNNDTYGFKPDSGKGYGSGGGGSRRDPANFVNTLGKLTDFSSGIKRYENDEAEVPPQIMQLFARLQAGKGGRAKPKLGASSSGR